MDTIQVVSNWLSEVEVVVEVARNVVRGGSLLRSREVMPAHGENMSVIGQIFVSLKPQCHTHE